MGWNVQSTPHWSNGYVLFLVMMYDLNVGRNKQEDQLGSNFQKTYIVHGSRQNWSKHMKEDTSDRAEPQNQLYIEP